MMDGGPAFPRPVSEDRSNGDLPDGNDIITEQEGMSLRDYFAGQALVGFIACGSVAKAIASADSTVPTGLALLAQGSYDVADAMIEARTK